MRGISVQCQVQSPFTLPVLKSVPKASIDGKKAQPEEIEKQGHSN